MGVSSDSPEAGEGHPRGEEPSRGGKTAVEVPVELRDVRREHAANLLACNTAARSGLKANWSDFLLSQYVTKLSLHSVLLLFSNEGDL